MIFTKRLRDRVRSGNDVYLVRFHYIPPTRTRIDRSKPNSSSKEKVRGKRMRRCLHRYPRLPITTAHLCAGAIRTYSTPRLLRAGRLRETRSCLPSSHPPCQSKAERCPAIESRGQGRGQYDRQTRATSTNTRWGLLILEIVCKAGCRGRPWRWISRPPKTRSGDSRRDRRSRTVRTHDE